MTFVLMLTFAERHRERHNLRNTIHRIKIFHLLGKSRKDLLTRTWKKIIIYMETLTCVP